MHVRPTNVVVTRSRSDRTKHTLRIYFMDRTIGMYAGAARTSTRSSAAQRAGALASYDPTAEHSIPKTKCLPYTQFANAGTWGLQLGCDAVTRTGA